jgi:hypothetical protein
MKPSTRIGADPTFCKLCGDRYWSWGAHAERCTVSRSTLSERGSDWTATGAKSDAPVVGETPAVARSESVEPPCDCPPGFQHQPTCHIVTGQPTPKEPT